jgi:AcrR family transcriptional regulator
MVKLAVMEGKPSLRERKRTAAMRRISQAALDLFDQRGFDNVTIEQIAEAAEVSPSSVYRYFGTKEQVVLRDEFEPQFFDLLVSEFASHPPVEAMRRAIAQIMSEFFGDDDELAQRRTRYSLEEPRLRARWAQQADDFAHMVAEALAQATGRRPDELEVQVIASSLVWALIAAIRDWHAAGYATPLEDGFDRALGLVERGLRLEGSPSPRPRRAPTSSKKW